MIAPAIIQLAGRTNSARVDALAAALDSIPYMHATADLVDEIAEAFDQSAHGLMADVEGRRDQIAEDVAAEGGVSPANWYGPAEWTRWGEEECAARNDEADREWLAQFVSLLSESAVAYLMAAE